MLDRFDPEKIKGFYEKYFQTREELDEFIKQANGQTQTERIKFLVYWLVGIADGQELVVENRSSLKIFFLIVLAESIAKMADNYEGESYSRKYTKNFFKNADPKDQEKLLKEFIYKRPEDRGRLFKKIIPPVNLNIDYVADFFYSIRCDLAHQGIFWQFFFNSDVHNTTVSIKSAEFGFSVALKYSDFKDFIVKTTIKFIMEYKS